MPCNGRADGGNRFAPIVAVAGQAGRRGLTTGRTTTTPFDTAVLNNLDRYQLALDAIGRIPRLAGQVQSENVRYWATMERHKLYISEHGDDMPEVRDWSWHR